MLSRSLNVQTCYDQNAANARFPKVYMVNRSVQMHPPYERQPSGHGRYLRLRGREFEMAGADESNFRLVMLLYAEIKHSDRFKLVVGLGTANQTALFLHSMAMLL